MKANKIFDFLKLKKNRAIPQKSARRTGMIFTMTTRPAGSFGRGSAGNDLAGRRRICQPARHDRTTQTPAVINGDVFCHWSCHIWFRR